MYVVLMYILYNRNTYYSQNNEVKWDLQKLERKCFLNGIGFWVRIERLYLILNKIVNSLLLIAINYQLYRIDTIESSKWQLHRLNGDVMMPISLLRIQHLIKFFHFLKNSRQQAMFTVCTYIFNNLKKGLISAHPSCWIVTRNKQI